MCHISCKAPHIIQVHSDTVVITQERVLVDTLEVYKDTIIFQDRIKIQLRYQDREVFVRAECPGDTIRVQTTRIITNTKELSRSRNWVGALFMTCLVLFILLLLKR